MADTNPGIAHASMTLEYYSKLKKLEDADDETLVVRLFTDLLHFFHPDTFDTPAALREGLAKAEELYYTEQKED